MPTKSYNLEKNIKKHTDDEIVDMPCNKNVN